MADLDTVRRALGVDKINLIGVSYGTRVAQQYAARHPQHTRAIVLDGVAPNELVVGGEFARTFERALDLQIAQCRQRPQCRQRFPQDLRAQLRARGFRGVSLQQALLGLAGRVEGVVLEGGHRWEPRD